MQFYLYVFERDGREVYFYAHDKEGAIRQYEEEYGKTPPGGKPPEVKRRENW
jgi:hypothetical protein